MEILIENKESLVEKIREYLLDDLQKTLETLELDEEEKYANIILSRKKLLVDSENIADLIYSAYEM